ncbi:MAG: monovalent cation/H+ antiporter complex subunit F [Acidimicrobiales bacterium]
MTNLYGVGCITELACAAIVFVRLVLGPTVSDRLVALNTMSTQATLAVIYFAAFADRSIYLEVSLWLASFSYLATIVWSRFLERGLL